MRVYVQELAQESNASKTKRHIDIFKGLQEYAHYEDTQIIATILSSDGSSMFVLQIER